MPSRNKGMRWTWSKGCKCGDCRECKHRIYAREYWHAKGKFKREVVEQQAKLAKESMREPIKHYEWDRT